LLYLALRFSLAANHRNRAAIASFRGRGEWARRLGLPPIRLSIVRSGIMYHIDSICMQLARRKGQIPKPSSNTSNRSETQDSRCTVSLGSMCWANVGRSSASHYSDFRTLPRNIQKSKQVRYVAWIASCKAPESGQLFRHCSK
jgi:hypothetical protein